jgi:putative transposase
MGTHPHVVCTSTSGQAAFSAFWKAVNQAFARWYNRARNRRGQVVMERLRSPRIQGGGGHLLAVMRYGDLNPVRAGLVRSAKDWRWSSYRHYAFGERDPLIDDAPEYLELGTTAAQRRRSYQGLHALISTRDLRVRRTDLVVSPFIGDQVWVARRWRAAGPSPPEDRRP